MNTFFDKFACLNDAFIINFSLTNPSKGRIDQNKWIAFV